MNHFNYKKYKRYEPIKLIDRTWPNNTITKAPIWCSVDLRDGNQALEIPMSLEQKIDFFNYLVNIGFKEIEIGFPAASDTEFEFTRTLIEKNLIPDDVVVQVLTQARDPIIEKTFEALEGIKKAIVHVYNSTSTLQRNVVFNASKDEVKKIAISGAEKLKYMAQKYGKEKFIFQYSPESFTGTEVDYAVEVCNAVIDIWKPTKDNKVIINLPATVEMTTPNIYADQIEYVCRNIKNRDNIIISLHTHNDRGTAIAASELGLLAGADRIEGTLFGNGERTGNADITALALNMFTQGINPYLDFSNINEAIETYEKSTHMSIHKRQPYAGELVYTAFSGSHQDAIHKGLEKIKENSEIWEVPYLPIDPFDVGRNYDPVIRINSQSGKSGSAYILKTNYGLNIPKNMQQHFGNLVTKISDEKNQELSPKDLYELFCNQYVNIHSPIKLINFKEIFDNNTNLEFVIDFENEIEIINSVGKGLLEAFCKGLITRFDLHFEITDYMEHSLSNSTHSKAITYLQIKYKDQFIYGSGISNSIAKSSIYSVLSCFNKILIFLNKNSKFSIDKNIKF
ncbi:2-isopropylmalate synthase [Anaerophilus nitritogenes]|uniref:2-isopropylmalate synthase n=1 Tax=Anaerophilus nitritogenes TaxID=2498136 RepID=UPI00101C818D|nr:2-isopropylmalate synthase [Anaerophilus nitritogenes]